MHYTFHGLFGVRFEWKVLKNLSVMDRAYGCKDDIPFRSYV